MTFDFRNSSRCMIYGKMEKIIQEMQHPETGVPVKCQKSLLNVVPSVFTGEDFILWLTQHRNMSEEEAQYLATLICHYGYIFPVTDIKCLNVKNDNSFYRFQNPYYWISQNSDPDNMEYAIHLLKRSMRSWQKHGLEEHEQVALFKLQKILCDKNDFISRQARDQVKIAKQRTKGDKALLDSQERAFWKIHRPPPNYAKCLDEGLRHNFTPAEIASRKLRVDILLRNVCVLRSSFMLCRVKTSQALEMYSLRNEKYHDYDPFLHAVYPRNPWISDDPSFWDLCCNHNDLLTLHHVQRWALSFADLMSDKLGISEFENFLMKEYSEENLHFWQACEELKCAPMSEVTDRIDLMNRQFLTEGSSNEVNIDSKTGQQVQSNIRMGQQSGKPCRFAFQPAQEHIFLLMKKDSFSRFLRSDHYKGLLSSTAAQPDGKKRFFHFGSRGKNIRTPTLRQDQRGSDISASMEEEVEGGGAMIPVALRSYSTGNLHELEGLPLPARHLLATHESTLTRCETSPILSRRHAPMPSSLPGGVRRSTHDISGSDKLSLVHPDSPVPGCRKSFIEMMPDTTT